ncbi:MAG: signal peptidase I [Verrucomicrobiota bacterium]
MFQARYLKEGKMLCKGVKKFVRYKRDLISEERMAKIDNAYAAFEQSLRDRDPEKAEKLAKELTTVCEKSVQDYRSSAWGENVEVIFVAVVVALGVRAYFLQPFKIPTGSMQPTLNGVIATPAAEREGASFAEPNMVYRLWDKIVRGRTWVDSEVKTDDRVVRIEQHTRMKFFTSTKVICESGQVYSIATPLEKASELGSLAFFGQFRKLNPGSPEFMQNNPSGRAQEILIPRRDPSGIPVDVRIREGEILARGFVDTGDQVLVDKMSYHFRKPKRGEVFVFTTKDLPIAVNPSFGSQHYIKRLVGVPGDDLRVSEPNLYVNGDLAAESGMQRVMSMENGHKGYTESGTNLTAALGDGEYWAMGDNSGNSLDSRSWGAVPQANLVGPALVVYWPFTSHWGRIR